MKHRFLPLLAVVTVSSCTPQAQPTPETSVVRQTYDISCDDAHRIAAKAIRVRNLKVTDVQRGPSGGVIRGANGEELEIRVSCEAGGVTVSASGGHWMEQGVRMSFQNFVESGERIWPPPKGPKVLVEAYPGVEARLWFATEPEGMSLFRVRVVNGGSRPIRIDPSRIRGGEGGRAMTPEAAVQRLGDPGASARLFSRVTLNQGEEASGLVFLPAGTYDSIVVTVVDVETGEGDDFEVFLKPQG